MANGRKESMAGRLTNKCSKFCDLTYRLPNRSANVFGTRLTPLLETHTCDNACIGRAEVDPPTSVGAPSPYYRPQTHRGLLPSPPSEIRGEGAGGRGGADRRYKEPTRRSGNTVLSRGQSSRHSSVHIPHSQHETGELAGAAVSSV